MVVRESKTSHGGQSRGKTSDDAQTEARQFQQSKVSTRNISIQYRPVVPLPQTYLFIAERTDASGQVSSQRGPSRDSVTTVVNLSRC